jgi:hypothetical protein
LDHSPAYFNLHFVTTRPKCNIFIAITIILDRVCLYHWCHIDMNVCDSPDKPVQFIRFANRSGRNIHVVDSLYSKEHLQGNQTLVFEVDKRAVHHSPKQGSLCSLSL